MSCPNCHHGESDHVYYPASMSGPEEQGCRKCEDCRLSPFDIQEHEREVRS